MPISLLLDPFYDFVLVAISSVYVCMLVIVGLVGNTITFLVFCRPRLKNTNLSFLIRVLTINGNVFLIMYGIPNVLDGDLSGNVYSCHVLRVVSHSLIYVDSWLYVIICADRLFAVSYPIKYQSDSRRHWFYAAVPIIFLTALIIRLPAIFSTRLHFNINSSDWHCEIVFQTEHISFLKYYIVVGFLGNILPGIILITGSVRLAVVLKKTAKNTEVNIGKEGLMKRKYEADLVSRQIIISSLVHVMFLIPYYIWRVLRLCGAIVTVAFYGAVFAVMSTNIAVPIFIFIFPHPRPRAECVDLFHETLTVAIQLNKSHSDTSNKKKPSFQ